VIDVDAEEGVKPAARRPRNPDRAKASARSAVDPITRDRDEARSTSHPALPGPVEAPVQSAAIPAAPEPIRVDMLMQSEDLAPAQPATLSVAGLATARPDASIDNAIDDLITRLAAFCLDQLEKTVTLSDAVDLNADADVLENELQVRV